MDDTKVYTQEQKTESLRKAFIEAGYDMASSQAESMEEDTESWGEDMIEGKINPKCFGIRCYKKSPSPFHDVWSSLLIL